MRTPGTTVGRMLAGVVGVVVAVAALKLARPVFVPLVAGLFLAVLARPLHVRVRAAMPSGLRWLGLTVALLAVLAGVVAFVGALSWSGYAVAQELRERRPTIEARIEQLRTRAAALGLPVSPPAAGQTGQPGGQSAPAGSGGGSTGGGSTGGASAGGTSGGGTQALAASWSALRPVTTAVAGLLLALAFAALGLAEADEARRRVARVGHGAGARRFLDAVDEAAPAFRRYVWVKSLTSTITGVATWLASLAFGLPLAAVWGFLAFLLEFVPSVGSLLAVIPPTLMALAAEGPARAGVVFLAIGALQVVLGNVVDPRIEGRLMAVSPFGVLLSIVFWGWLWGAVGALLAVPMTVALVIASRHLPGTHGVATVVAGDGVPEEEQERTAEDGRGS